MLLLHLSFLEQKVQLFQNQAFAILFFFLSEHYLQISADFLLLMILFVVPEQLLLSLRQPYHTSVLPRSGVLKNHRCFQSSNHKFYRKDEVTRQIVRFSVDILLFNKLQRHSMNHSTETDFQNHVSLLVRNRALTSALPFIETISQRDYIIFLRESRYQDAKTFENVHSRNSRLLLKTLYS